MQEIFHPADHERFASKTSLDFLLRHILVMGKLKPPGKNSRQIPEKPYRLADTTTMHKNPTSIATIRSQSTTATKTLVVSSLDFHSKKLKTSTCSNNNSFKLNSLVSFLLSCFILTLPKENRTAVQYVAQTRWFLLRRRQG